MDTLGILVLFRCRQIGLKGAERPMEILIVARSKIVAATELVVFVEGLVFPLWFSYRK